jgi:hypothetical protein
MALEDQLREVAREMAGAQRRSIPSGLQRVLSYQPHIGQGFQCPRCWIEHERRSVLQQVATSIDDDVFRCSTCQLDLVF